jgi:glycosyltransferase involved in cell wall biosynthesis
MVFIGTGPYLDSLRKPVHRLGIEDRVHFLGYVPHSEIPKYLSHLDIVVLPSETQPNWKEQFGRVLVESMACGTAVLGSDSGEIPHLIERTGGGLTFPEGDAAACARQLQRLLDDNELRTTLARRGRDSVYDRYTHAALAQDFIRTIESL